MGEYAWDDLKIAKKEYGKRIHVSRRTPENNYCEVYSRCGTLLYRNTSMKKVAKHIQTKEFRQDLWAVEKGNLWTWKSDTHGPDFVNKRGDDQIQLKKDEEWN